MKLNKWMLAGIGLGFSSLWSCPTLAALTTEQNFGLEVKATAQSEGDRDLGTRSGGDVNGIGLDLRPWAYGEWGNWSGYFMGQAVTATDTIQTDPLVQPDQPASGNSRYYSKDREAKDSYLALRELWVGYSGLTPYPGELFKFGRQRLRQNDGQWHDNYIESLTWNFDTTLLKADVGVGQRFSDYRTDYSRLSPTDKDRTHFWGDAAYQWTPGQWIGIRAHHVDDDGKLPSAGEEVDDLDKRENAKLTWLGIEADSDAYNHRNLNTINYWGSLTGMTGNRKRVSTSSTSDEIVTAGERSSQDVSGWATDMGIRFRLDPQWQVGGAYSRASKNYEQNGLQSNRSNWTGTRARISRFGEAYQAEMANVQSASLFASWEMQDEYDASLIYHKFWRVDGSSGVGSNNINAIGEDPVGSSQFSVLPLEDGKKDLGQELDLVVSKYFKQGLLPAAVAQSIDEPSALVRLRAGLFKPGDAYGSGVDSYMHRAIVDVIWRF
ncbi:MULTISPECIES: alginate export family protein [unclassified Pseudomonas]|uniref:alginate export family protein n=1 Tax=unclassified Pseudomonas TaxID=196821 RepID=UPI000BDD3071|nr:MULTISPECIES: alginate export family protein [unclassified Pseudomonas]PVZ12396.1 alginate production protein [Pseudomonas sp. URIL14HWK12:I12]PVZ23452.1 alginate production protein [Pseudomonas sp. URIL14HWK12:I10]PVZ32782.1 alginate production protein [Pseudomonas sp. URIL14HWK12:I11]SNZ14072.1 alginate export porin (TC 1.B.13) [Pseudomonas sp. URIL14HWK12:I9]